MNRNKAKRIKENIRGAVLLAEPLSSHTTFRVGGPAEMLVQPRDSSDAAWVYRFARGEKIPLTIIGAGSNVIAPDEGIPGIVLQMKSIAPRVRFGGGGHVRCDAGVLLNDLIIAAARRGLTGLESLAGIPGAVGGAIVMNAGTREVEVSNRVAKVVVMTSSGTRRVFAKEELSFAYRHSVFLGSDWLVLGVEFVLPPGDPGRSLDLVTEHLKDRERKYPLSVPSAGSVFKRPPGDHPGRLIEAAGCKGMRVGDAMVSDRHANFIVNVGKASAADIVTLIAQVRSRVFETTGMYLELEQIPLSSSPQ
jgi:UDP-N-acetylmuramate dehydrogenase